jgi:peroxiredoxin Q/BCP
MLGLPRRTFYRCLQEYGILEETLMVRKFSLLVGLCTVLGLAGCSKSQKSTGATTTTATAGELSVGSLAPDFSAKSHDGKDVKLSAFRGHPVVIYFYPKDETPGCTKEACSLRDSWNELDKKGVVLIGISGDSDESHRNFAEHHKLPFMLVSDPDGKIAAQFGVPFRLGYASRQTIVIDSEGKIKKVYRSVDVSKHAQEILGDVS